MSGGIEGNEALTAITAGALGLHFPWHLPGAWRGAGPRRPRTPGGALRTLALSVSLGGGVTLALLLLSVMQSWHGGHDHHPG